MHRSISSMSGDEKDVICRSASLAKNETACKLLQFIIRVHKNIQQYMQFILSETGTVHGTCIVAITGCFQVVTGKAKIILDKFI